MWETLSPSPARSGLLSWRVVLRAHKCLPTCPRLPLSSGSPSARPQLPISTVRAPRDCQPPASLGLKYPLTPPPPVKPSAPPWLLVPSSLPWPIGPLAKPGSLVPPAPPWSGIDLPAPRDSTPPAAPRLSGSFRLQPSPRLLLSPLLLRLHCGPLDPCLRRPHHLLCFGPPDQPPVTTLSAICSAAVGGHSSSMAPPSIGLTVGRNRGCGLGPAWLLLLRLLPGSSLLRHPDLFLFVLILVMFLSSFSLIICWFPTPQYPVHLSPLLFSLCLSGLYRLAHVSLMFPCGTPFFWNIIKTIRFDTHLRHHSYRVWHE